MVWGPRFGPFSGLDRFPMLLQNKLRFYQSWIWYNLEYKNYHYNSMFGSNVYASVNQWSPLWSAFVVFTTRNRRNSLRGLIGLRVIVLWSFKLLMSSITSRRVKSKLLMLVMRSTCSWGNVKSSSSMVQAIWASVNQTSTRCWTSDSVKNRATLGYMQQSPSMIWLPFTTHSWCTEWDKSTAKGAPLLICIDLRVNNNYSQKFPTSKWIVNIGPFAEPPNTMIVDRAFIVWLRMCKCEYVYGAISIPTQNDFFSDTKPQKCILGILWMSIPQNVYSGWIC